MDYYSAIKRNEIEPFIETWMDLESVIQSEVSQKKKNIYCVHMEARKMVPKSLFAGVETQTYRRELWTQQRR